MNHDERIDDYKDFVDHELNDRYHKYMDDFGPWPHFKESKRGLEEIKGDCVKLKEILPGCIKLIFGIFIAIILVFSVWFVVPFASVFARYITMPVRKFFYVRNFKKELKNESKED